MNHMFVDGLALCGVVGRFSWTIYVAAVTCPACLATLRFLGAPASPVHRRPSRYRGLLIGMPRPRKSG
jgi:hypothetical protein